MRVESSVSALQRPLHDNAIKRNKQEDNAKQDVASAFDGAKNVQDLSLIHI